VRLAAFTAGVAFLESTFYAVVPPLVPGFIHDLGLSTTEIGVMVAAYPAGVLCATLPAIALTDWAGERTSALAGVVILLASTLAFGWAPSPLAIDVARFAQGAGGAIAWAGGLGWLVSAAPADRRASAIGRTLGAAGIGMVIGPLIGAAASQLGRPAVFTALAIALAGVVVIAPAAPVAVRVRRRATEALISLLSHGQAALGASLLVTVGVASGTIAALMPLLVISRHGSAAAVAAILTTSYLLGSVLNVVMGGTADRIGRHFPTVGAFALAAALLPLLPNVTALWALAGLAVVAIGFVSSLWTPTAAMVSDGAARGAGQGVGVAALNAAWAAGASAGAYIASRLAESRGPALPFEIVGALCAICVVAVVLHELRARLRSVT
jgi:MFS family permease